MAQAQIGFHSSDLVEGRFFVGQEGEFTILTSSGVPQESFSGKLLLFWGCSTVYGFFLTESGYVAGRLA